MHYFSIANISPELSEEPTQAHLNSVSKRQFTDEEWNLEGVMVVVDSRGGILEVALSLSLGCSRCSKAKVCWFEASFFPLHLQVSFHGRPKSELPHP